MRSNLVIMTSDPFPAETHWYDLPDDAELEVAES